jgi:hypothetical protein
VTLQRRTQSSGNTAEPARPTAFQINDQAFVVLSQTKGTIGKVFQAAGVAIPPALRPA